MKNLILLSISLLLFSCTQNNKATIQSPDGKIELSFGINEISEIYYSVDFEDSTIIQNSNMGFQIRDEKDFGKDLRIISSKETRVNKTWNPVYGERSEVTDNYNLLEIRLQETIAPEREFEIIVRVYNEGVAFNYTFLPQSGKDSIVILSENTEFNLSKNYNCWVSDRAQSEYRKQDINTIERPAERPFVIEAGNNFLALGEAKLIDFGRMKFSAGEKENSLVAMIHGEPKIPLPYTTPWRTIMIGKSAGELLENNYFIENLNDPCAIKDVSWIRPGKIIREVTLTTKGGLACVDFAAANGLQYVEFDAGWYGPEGNPESDATTVTVDPKRSPGPLNLQQVIDYGKKKEIGIIVYVNRRALEKQLDVILPLFKKWGIAGVKYGFVQVGSQKWTNWLHMAVRKAAENNLMVDIHDEYRPTGFSRTYPNLMTQEGIRGDEESPSNEHTLTTLFTRMIAGAGDNTNCYYAPRVTEKMGGHVSQLAKAVMLYSPWQFLYWYDRPEGSPGKKGGAGSADGYIKKDPELEWYKNLPAAWDESKVLEGTIGEFATIVRRSGNEWFLGSLTGNTEKSLKINLDFLDANTNYKAIIYSHDAGLQTFTKAKVTSLTVNSESDLDFKINNNSGLAIHFQKE